MLNTALEETEQELTTVELKIPVNLAPYIRRTDDSIKLYAMLIYPCIQNGEISHGKAAEILGITKNDLLDIYGEFGIPYYNQTCEELANDINVLKKLRTKK